MSDYLIPMDENIIEAVAKAICQARVRADANLILGEAVGINLETNELLEQSFEKLFSKLWDGEEQEDMLQREAYRSDAKAAISALNLKLLTV